MIFVAAPRRHTPGALRTTVGALAAAATLGGCAGDLTPPAPGVDAVRISPRLTDVVNGGTAQFQAVVTGSPGVDPSVRWSLSTSSSTLAATISPTGELRTCYPGGRVTVVATSIADPSKADSVPISVRFAGGGWVLISNATRPGTTEMVDIVAPVRGAVDLELVLAPGPLGCRRVEHLEVRVRGMGRDTALFSRSFDPPFENDRVVVRVPFATAAQAGGAPAFPNGDYEVRSFVRLGGGGLTPYVATDPLAPVRVANP
jgi:hypothetical protein